jgi:hypothetical protein
VITQQQQQIPLPTLHHKDTGQQGVALLASLLPAKTLPTISDLIPPTIRKSDTTLLPALHLHHGKQLAQLTSTAAPDITTATGRAFITYQIKREQLLMWEKYRTSILLPHIV